MSERMSAKPFPRCQLLQPAARNEAGECTYSDDLQLAGRRDGSVPDSVILPAPRKPAEELVGDGEA